MSLPTDPLIRRAAAATVQIIHEGLGAGSGSVVEIVDGYACALTCAHLFRDERTKQTTRQGPLSVVEPGAASRYAVLIGIDPRTDLAAVCYVASSQTQAVPLTDSETASGTAVFQLGYPAGHSKTGPPHYRSGTLQGREQDGQYRFSFLPVGGDSGGGIYRASDGALLAVVSKRAYPGSGGGWGTGAGGADVSRFLQETCLPWIRKIRGGIKPNIPGTPQQPSPGGGKAPAGPAQPGGIGDPTPPPADPHRERLEALESSHAGLRGDFEKLRASGGEHADRLAKAESFLGRLQSDLEGARSLGGVHAERIDRAEKVLGTVQDGLAKAHAVHDRLDAVASKLGALEPVVEKAVTLSGWSAWLPAIASGAGLGGPGAALAIGLALAALRRKAGTQGRVTSIPPATNGPPQPSQILGLPPDKQDVILDLLHSLKAQRHQAAAVGEVKPGPVMTAHEFVNVPGGNAVVDAYEWAHRTVAEKYPGMTGAVQMIESLAKQRLSGAGVQEHA